MNSIQYATTIVIWLLVGMGAVALCTYVLRLLAMRRMRVDHNDFVAGVTNVLEKGNVEEAVLICEETPGPLARVVLTAISHRGANSFELRNAVDTAGRAEVARLGRRIAPIAIVSNLAPLVGLLGVVLGMIETVVSFGGNDVVSRTMLVEELVKTMMFAALGLAVAIPSHVMYSVMMLKISRLTTDLEAAASAIVCFIAAGKERK